MKLSFYNDSPNVGDLLNEYIWGKEFDLLNALEKFKNHEVLAIGSIFHKSFYKTDNTIVFGSGARSNDSIPPINSNWDIRFVRGPNTYRALKSQGVQSKYITDPGILISKYLPASLNKGLSNKQTIGLVPYYRSNLKAWKEVADIAKVNFISPTLNVEQFCSEISQCDLVITEAMHGAIIADSYRIPWIPYTSSTIMHEKETHAFKWNDWCKSMELEFNELHFLYFDNISKNTISKKIKYFIKKITELEKEIESLKFDYFTK